MEIKLLNLLARRPAPCEVCAPEPSADRRSAARLRAFPKVDYYVTEAAPKRVSVDVFQHLFQEPETVVLSLGLVVFYEDGAKFGVAQGAESAVLSNNTAAMVTMMVAPGEG